jgi:autotransporter passenger strand-loop-strand repeat protein
MAGGGNASGVTALAGGELIVLSGGSASGITVSSGGYEVFAVVSSGVTDSGGTLISGLSQTVLSGGSTISSFITRNGMIRLPGFLT